MSIAPRRIQLSRKKGFDLQAASLALNGLPAVNVSRPGKWGNPFTIAYWISHGYSRVQGQVTAVESFRRCLCENDEPMDDDYAARMAIIKRDIEELRGKNLACWCGLDEKCHADILLEIANRSNP